MLLLGPAERADVIVDFTDVPAATVDLLNLGPDEPFGGGVPGADFEIARPRHDRSGDAASTCWLAGPDTTTPPRPAARLPAITPLTARQERPLALLEEMSDVAGVTPPAEAMLGTVGRNVGHGTGTGTPMMWMDPVTENPALGATEVWEFYNFTADAHPIHVHEVQFQVVNRQPISFSEAEEIGRSRRRARGRGPSAGAVGGRVQGHGHRLPRRGHADPREVRDRRPLRVALPHRRARGQRDDAALPRGTTATGGARVISRTARHAGEVSTHRG